MTFEFYLIFRADGSMRMTRRATNLDRTERSMHVCADVPDEIFTTPSITASITVPVPEPMDLNIPVIEGKLRQAVGFDVDLKLRTIEDGGDNGQPD